MKKLDGRDRLQSVLAPGATGRWYAHDEALATVPKHVPEAALLRAHLLPEPGHAFVSGDFAAFEPRLLAHQSEDPYLIAGGQSPDIYRHLMPLLGVTDREVMKKGLLAMMYGTSARFFAAQLPLPMPDGYAIYENLEKLLKKALEFRKHVHKTDNVIARSLYGWRRRRRNHTRAEFARAAFNLRMQGTAGDLALSVEQAAFACAWLLQHRLASPSSL
jgi:DNA polymerase I-like protein with 3'-5' exonuclease and polymerase domains